jgi:hypothetical protein
MPKETIDRVWIPAVPPYEDMLLADRCIECGRWFFGWGGRRHHSYEVHWRRVHEKDQEGFVELIGVTQEEHDRIYAEVSEMMPLD